MRLIVKDRNKIDDGAVEDIDEVKGIFYTGGQYQVILGTGIVNKVYAQVSGVKKDAPEGETGSSEEAVPRGRFQKLQRGIRILSDVFLPIVPILGATGLFLGLKSVLLSDAFLNLFGMSASMIPSSWNTLLTVLTGTAFSFLPAFICWSAFKKFGGTPVIGFLIGLMLVSPSLPSAYDVAAGTASPIMILGLPIEGYQGSILTALLTGIIGATLEKWLRKRMPNSMDLIFTPFVVVIVMLLLAFFGFGPIVHVIEQGLVSTIKAFIQLPFGIGGLFVGVLYPLLVMTGLHQMSIIVETSLLAATKFNPVITVEAMYGFANAAICLAIALRSKKASQKSAGISATVTQFLGISEPALFGVTMRAGLPAILVLLFSSGIGGGVLALLKIKANSYGLAVLLSPLMYIYNSQQLIVYIIVGIATFVGAFIATNMFAIPHDEKSKEKHNSPEKAFEFDDGSTTALFSPVKGKIINITETKDPVFSQKMMGDGFAVIPESSDKIAEILSPVDGTITMLASTRHAIGVKTRDGLEVLIHLGIDTVELNGEPFTINVKVGDHVSLGQQLADMNVKKIEDAKKDPTVIVVLTNLGEKKRSFTFERDETQNSNMHQLAVGKLN